jgi:hypothetical protein
MTSFYGNFLPILENDEECNHLKSLRNSVIDIINNYPEKDKVVDILSKTGLEPSKAEDIYEFCNNVSKLLLDAEIIINMDLTDLEKVVNFIINKAILYNDFRLFTIDRFAKYGKFSNCHEARRALRFLHYHIYSTCKREFSPDTLEILLKTDMGVPEDKTKVIIDNIKNNLLEMQQAYLTSQIKFMYNKINNIQSHYLEEKKVNHPPVLTSK